MKEQRITKIYYSILFLYSAILTVSYLNVARGGVVLWVGINAFYFSMLIFASSLIYIILNSNCDHLRKLELPGVMLFCLSLPLLLYVGYPQFPLDLDSIISIQSISFISRYGFSTELAGNNDLWISATYSLPMLSILSASFMQILGITYITTSKFIIIILTCIFFLIYYVFILKFIGKKVALISLILISTFTWGYSGVFNNVDLALVFFVLSWWILLWRDKYKGYSINIAILQVIVLIAFVMSHHLTYVILVMSIIYLSMYYFIVKQKKEVNIVILAIILMFSYYIYVYFGPLEVIINAFTRQLVIEGKSATKVVSWTYPIIFQRASYVLFLILPTIISIVEIKINLKEFLFKKYTFPLSIGIFLFLISVIGVLIRVPWTWDRITIFAWMFFIPGAISILLESKILKNIFIKKSVIIFICSLLVIGNVYVIPEKILDHSGDKEYKGDFKNWIKVQELDSTVFLDKNINRQNLVIGDDVIWRSYSSNLKKYANFEYLPIDFDKINNSKFTYIVFREENFYRIIKNFSRKIPDNETESDETITINIDQKVSSDKNTSLIYNNKEVRIFLLHSDL